MLSLAVTIVPFAACKQRLSGPGREMTPKPRQRLWGTQETEWRRQISARLHTVFVEAGSCVQSGEGSEPQFTHRKTTAVQRQQNDL